MGKYATADKLLARAEANGYKMGEHREEDEVRDRYKYVKKPKTDRLSADAEGQLESRRDAERLCPERATGSGRGHGPKQYLREGVDAPDPATVKDFLCFHVATSQGKDRREAYRRLRQYICRVVPLPASYESQGPRQTPRNEAKCIMGVSFSPDMGVE